MSFQSNHNAEEVQHSDFLQLENIGIIRIKSTSQIWEGFLKIPIVPPTNLLRLIYVHKKRLYNKESSLLSR